MPISLCTAYSAWSAKLLDDLNFDALLVGDSVAMVEHGYPNTLYADMEMMDFHVKSVVRGAQKTAVIADMPFMSYRKSLETGLECAERLMRSGAHAVKIEGAKGNETIISKLVESGIPVMGHLGLTPQHYHALGGFKVQGRSSEAHKNIFEDAERLEALGCFAVVLECVPVALAEKITEKLMIPTVGIGAGPSTDGQILVFHDILGLGASENQPKFMRSFLNGRALITEALLNFKKSVEDSDFPNLNESYL